MFAILFHEYGKIKCVSLPEPAFTGLKRGQEQKNIHGISILCGRLTLEVKRLVEV